MAIIDDSGLAGAEREAARAALCRDRALEAELGLILPALGPRERVAFWKAFARAAGGNRPAATVLEALVEAALQSGR
jgi:hypothetical protein